jgi:hypothetical protein
MSEWSCVAFAMLGLTACGGIATGTDGGSTDAAHNRDAGSVDARGDGGHDADAHVADASVEAAYLACMGDAGKLDDSLKVCKSSADCVIKQEQVDCCGSILYVGVNAASAAKFDGCEAVWAAHFPGCGCPPINMTEDGNNVSFGPDASVVHVHCADFTSSGGICLTSLP